MKLIFTSVLVLFLLFFVEARHKHLRHPKTSVQESAIKKQVLVHATKKGFQNLMEVLQPGNPVISKGLHQHNKLRENHHSDPLQMSSTLNTEAQKIAEAMATKSTLDVAMDRSMFAYGENVAKLSAGSVNNCDDAGEAATNIWYSQVQNYSYGDPRLNEFTDTFTQVVWKDSKEIGFGCARTPGSDNSDFYVVALYNPPGNIPRFLRANVFSTKPLHKLEDVYSSVFRKNTMQNKDRHIIKGVL